MQLPLNSTGECLGLTRGQWEPDWASIRNSHTLTAAPGLLAPVSGTPPPPKTWSQHQDLSLLKIIFAELFGFRRSSERVYWGGVEKQRLSLKLNLSFCFRVKVLKGKVNNVSSNYGVIKAAKCWFKWLCSCSLVAELDCNIIQRSYKLETEGFFPFQERQDPSCQC